MVSTTTTAQVLRNFQLVSHFIDANDIHIQIPTSCLTPFATRTQLIPISISATISIYEMFSFRRIIFHVPVVLLLLRKPNGKFRHSRDAFWTAQGLMHLICFLIEGFHYARTRMEPSNVRAGKMIWRWPQNVKLERTRTGIPKISVIDLTVQCFVSLR